MNPAAVFATVLVDELVRCGVTDAVLAPGSRSAPLALALHDAALSGHLRLHVRVDERSAGFLALGLAKDTGRPAMIGCTSGTAAANIFPSIVEASEAGVPMLVLTADRPPELRWTGANQTIDQLRLYGSFARWFCEVGVPERRPGAVAYWRSTACRAWAAAVGADAGPVHLNLALREPTPDTVDDRAPWPEPIDGRPFGAPWAAVRPIDPVRIEAALEDTLDTGDDRGAPSVERGLLVAGDGVRDPVPVVALAQQRGWPILAEPSSNARFGPNALTAYRYLLDIAEFRDRHRPELVVTTGRPTLSRAVLRLLESADTHVALTDRWWDPARTATRVGLPLAAATGPTQATGPARRRSGWLRDWLRADERVRQALDAELDAVDAPSEPRIARDLAARIPDGALLVAGPSLPIRHLDQHMARRRDIRILANRGVGGIDGLISTAIGAALAHSGPAYALLGDLTFLHDQNGLLLGPHEARPGLAVVVLDNDGGGIFSTLPRVGSAEAFDRVFVTPHGRDLTLAAAAAGVPCSTVEDPADLGDRLAGDGLRMVVVRTDRKSGADLDVRLRQVARDACLTEGETSDGT